MINHLEEMRESDASIKPAVNQCEFHPHCNTRDVLDYCRKNGIHFQAYSSLGGAHSHGALLREPLILDLSNKYACQPAQLLLAWALNQKVSVLPKTTNASRVSANFASLDLVLDEGDLEKIGNLSTGTRYCWDPTTVA
uniref:NADP-dependent oxidoreductase domain-containing protein n=1 Tax=Romanomermis culicivorax TaxID=13658 RepID=A0A915L188_ROMCU